MAHRRFGRIRVKSRLARVARVVGFVLALASYWAPWVAHKDAGLAIAEVDLAEFPKFMPQVRAHELFVWRESFYMALFALSIGLVVWAAIGPSPRSQEGRAKLRVRALRWLMWSLALLLPLTPSIFNVFESGEFRTQLMLVVIIALLMLLTPLLRRAPRWIIHAVLIVVFLFGALIPTIQLLYLKPALDDIYHQPVAIGWGVWAGLLGFGLLAVSQLLFMQSERDTQARKETR